MTNAKRAAFLAAYREVGNVKLAAAAAQVSRSTVYRWLQDADYAEEFTGGRMPPTQSDSKTGPPLKPVNQIQRPERCGMWQPPEVVAFTWHLDCDRATTQRIEVRFSSGDEGTVVELTHRDWHVFGDQATEQRSYYAGGWDGVLGRYTAG